MHELWHCRVSSAQSTSFIPKHCITPRACRAALPLAEPRQTADAPRWAGGQLLCRCGQRHAPHAVGLCRARCGLAHAGQEGRAQPRSLCACVALAAQRLDDLQHLWTSRARSAPDGSGPTAGAWPARQHHTLYDCGKKGWGDSSSSVAGARPVQAPLAPRARCWRQKPYVRSPPAPVRQMTYSCVRCELVAPATTQPGCSAQAGPHLRRMPRAAAPARKAKGGKRPGDGRVARLVAVEALDYQAVVHLRAALWLGSVRTVAPLYHQPAVLRQSTGSTACLLRITSTQKLLYALLILLPLAPTYD